MIPQSELAQLYRLYPDPDEGFTGHIGATVDFSNARSFLYDGKTWTKLNDPDLLAGLSVWGIFLIDTEDNQMLVGQSPDGDTFPMFLSERTAMAFVEALDVEDVPEGMMAGTYHTIILGK
jgi:hypothetical protein